MIRFGGSRTALMSLLKNRALARIVSYARVLIRVRERREEPERCFVEV